MSKKDKSALIGGMGIAMSLVTSVVEKGRRHGLSDEDIHRLVTPDGEHLLDKLIELMVEDKKPKTTVQWITVHINFDRTLAQMRDEAGCEVDENVNEQNYPLEIGQSGECELALVCFNRYIVDAEDPEKSVLLKELDKLDLKPVGSPELFAVAEQYPDLPLIPEGRIENEIVARHQVWAHPKHGFLHCTCLFKDQSGRSVRTDDVDISRNGDTLYLAVRK